MVRRGGAVTNGYRTVQIDTRPEYGCDMRLLCLRSSNQKQGQPMYSRQLAAPMQFRLTEAGRPTASVKNLGGLLAAQPVETFEAGQTVFWEGDNAAHVFEIAEGCLRLCRILPDGRRAVVGFSFGGEMLGASSPRSYLYTAEAVTKVRLRRLGRTRFHAALDEMPELRPHLFACVCEEMRAAHQHMVLLGQLGAEERVVSFLLSAARRTRADRKRPITIELPMSRLDIADYLGLTIETVCRTISKLKRDGLIALKGRHAVVLTRVAGLMEMADWLDDEETPNAGSATPCPASRPN